MATKNSKAKLEQQGSVTFQLSANRKEKLEALAFRLGLRRIVDGAERGNTSAILNLFVEFIFENIDLFSAWIAKRAKG
jgi:hypothetical protein